VSIWIAAFTLAYLARLASAGRAPHVDADSASPLADAHPSPVGAPPARKTMGHSVAVIVARGAES
jgi:hypothetical protein